MGRGPYRTLGSVVSACDRPNPFVIRAVDAATQFMEDRLQRFLDELMVNNIPTVSTVMVQNEILRTREELYRHLGREVPRGAPDTGTDSR